jgi:hypothetical protein
MSAHRNSIGSSFDDIVIGSRRLGIGHGVAAFIAVASLWFRLGPEYFGNPRPHRIDGVVLFTTVAAWLPCLLSWIVAKQYIVGRRQARNYLICLGLVTTASALGYAGKLGTSVPAYTVSIVATLILGLSLVFCAAIAVSSSNKSLERTREG